MSATGSTDTRPEAAAPARGRAMSVWRLEWLRLVRTKRLVALGATFVFFGITAPPLTRWQDELMARVGGGARIELPPPTSTTAVASYLGNAVQLGGLALVVVASLALAIDTDRSTSVFLRTRLRRPWMLVLPRWAVATGAGLAMFVAGLLCTWYGSVLLLDPLPAGTMVVGTLLTLPYFAFLTAVAAVLATRSHGVALPVVGALGAAVVLGIVGSIRELGQWLPSHLVGLLPDLLGGGRVLDTMPAVAVLLVAIAVLLAVAVRLTASREV